MRLLIRVWYVLNRKNGAKLARLSYETISSYKDAKGNNFKLVKIHLETGRHHQIRVQFSSRGFPLYGDQKYGTGPKGEQIALWAYEVTFKHPVKDEIMTFTCTPKNVGIWKKFTL